MHIRLSTGADGRSIMESGYDPMFVAEFKAAIPFHEREWITEPPKHWKLTPFGTSTLLHWCQQQGHTVLDEREESQLKRQRDQYATMPNDLKAGFATLYLAPAAPLLVAEASYKALSRYFHPDMPDGDHDIMEELNHAIHTIRRYLDATQSV